MKKILLGMALLAVFIAVLLLRPRPVSKPAATPGPKPVAMTPAPATNAVRTNKTGFYPLNKLKTRYSDFSDAERAEFQSNFVARYKPALDKWANAFSGRVPFSPDEITPDKFAERIGPTARYHEYIFVVDGITIGVADKVGTAARVDYLNAPTQTRQLATIPTSGQPPIATVPITRDEIIQMLYADGGVQFKPSDIRITPTGISGSLNGGAYIGVGGNPDNEASWDYDIVLGSDGKLAFYLRPKPQ